MQCDLQSAARGLGAQQLGHNGRNAPKLPRRISGDGPSPAHWGAWGGRQHGALIPQLPHATRSCQFHSEGSFSGLGCLCFLGSRGLSRPKFVLFAELMQARRKRHKTSQKQKFPNNRWNLALVRRSLESNLHGELPLMCFPASFLLAGVPLLCDVIVSAATTIGTHLAFLFVGTRLGSASKVWLLQQIIERIQRIRSATTCAHVQTSSKK